MLIPIPIGTNFTATMSGTVRKWVRCEHCAAEFVYLMQRTVAGSGFIVLSIDGARASQRAQATAERQLEKSLEHDFELVPCPSCGSYQSYMVERLRTKSRSDLLFLAALLLMVVFGFAALLSGMELLSGQLDAAEVAARETSLLVSLLAFVGAGALLYLYYKSPRRFDPNVAEGVNERIAFGKQMACLKEDYERMLFASAEPAEMTPRVPPPPGTFTSPGMPARESRSDDALTEKPLFSPSSPPSWAVSEQQDVDLPARSPLSTASEILPTHPAPGVTWIRCEHCQAEYMCRMPRVGYQGGEDRLLTDARRVAELARKAANLPGQQHRTDFPLVPCPACGCYQSYMIPIIQKRDCPQGLFHRAALLLIISGPALVVAACGVADSHLPGDGKVLFVMVAILAVLGLLASLRCFLLHSRRVGQFDPNEPEGRETRRKVGQQNAWLKADCEAMLHRRSRGEEVAQAEFQRAQELSRNNRPLEALETMQFILEAYPETRAAQLIRELLARQTGGFMTGL
jgi:hypothetical protein